MSTGKDLRQLVRKMKRAGYTVEDTGGGHVRIHLPGGIVIIPKTSNKPRSLHNARAEIRRHGGDPDAPPKRKGKG